TGHGQEATGTGPRLAIGGGAGAVDGESRLMRRGVRSTYDPDIARRRRNTREQDIGEEAALGGIGTGRNAPGVAIPVQQQGALLTRAVDQESGAKRPYIVRRNGRDALQAVRLENTIGAVVGTGNNRPASAVPVLDQGQGGGALWRRNGCGEAHGPSV